MAGGRPKADQTTKRESVVSVRLSVAERAALEARAAAAGLPVSEYVRAVLVQAPPPRRRTATGGAGRLSLQEFRELNAVGINLNQIARVMNTGRAHVQQDELAEAIGKLHAIFDRYLP